MLAELLAALTLPDKEASMLKADTALLTLASEAEAESANRYICHIVIFCVQLRDAAFIGPF